MDKMAKKWPKMAIFAISRGTPRETRKTPKIMPILAGFFPKLSESFGFSTVLGVLSIKEDKAIALR